MTTRPPSQTAPSVTELSPTIDSVTKPNTLSIESPDASTTAIRIGSLFAESTDSLDSKTTDYTVENGRRYHAYHQGRYVMPNDEKEQDKLFLSHLVNEIALEGNLFLAPIAGNPKRVLDIGTGRGDWAIDFADQYPDSEVLGTDLSPIQPSWVPQNLCFEVDDAEDDWMYNSPFDFIHTRTLCGGIKDWPRFYRQAMKHLNPGGWIELQENDAWFQGIDGNTPPNTLLFLETLDEASKRSGCRLNVAQEQKQLLIEGGFVDVQDVVYKFPLSPWHEDEKMQEIANHRGPAMCQGIEGYSLALLTRYMGWTWLEVQVLLAKVRTDVRDVKNKLYINQHFIYGRKPGGAPQHISTPRPAMPLGMFEIR